MLERLSYLVDNNDLKLHARAEKRESSERKLSKISITHSLASG